MSHSNYSALVILLPLFLFIGACGSEDQSTFCESKSLYLSITSDVISPSLITEFSLNADGKYWLYRNVENFDTIQGSLDRSEVTKIMKSSKEISLPLQEAIVSDAGIYQLRLLCLDGSERTANYEGIRTLPIATKDFISNVENLVQKIGIKYHDGQ